MTSPVASPAEPRAARSGAIDSAPTSSARLALCSVFTPTWTSSLLLAACFFLPLVRGCGEEVIYPYSFYGEVKSAADFFGLQVYTWSYWFGLLTAGGALLITLSRNPKHYRTVWWGYAALIVATTIGIWFALGIEARKNAEQPAAKELLWESLWFLAPTAILAAAVVLTYFNCRTWFVAALWLRLFLALLATIWFALFFGDLLFGGRLSLAACVVLLAATISERVLGLRALGVDPDKLRRKRDGRSPAAFRPLSRRWAIALAGLPILAALACMPLLLSADPPAVASQPVFSNPNVPVAGALTVHGRPIAALAPAGVRVTFLEIDASGALQNDAYAVQYDAATSRYQADLPPGRYRVVVQVRGARGSSGESLGPPFSAGQATTDVLVLGPDDALDIELAPVSE